MMLKYAYFPGCSLKGAAIEYDMSMQTVFKKLNIELVEIADWHCCGSTPAHMTNELLSVALPMDHILWAQQNDLEITVPCAACFSVFKTAIYRMENEPDTRQKIERILETKYQHNCQVKHALDVIVSDYGLERLAEHIAVKLEGLKVAAYYGCLLTRPPKVKEFDDPENPQMMDTLMRELGAEAVNWTHKTICCGASFSATEPDIVLHQSGQILIKAKKAGAECIVVACPLCQPNLDLYQIDIEKKWGESFNMPIFYFTQLMGVALGLEPRELGLDKNVVEPWNLLRRYIEVDYREFR